MSVKAWLGSISNCLSKSSCKLLLYLLILTLLGGCRNPAASPTPGFISYTNTPFATLTATPTQAKTATILPIRTATLTPSPTAPEIPTITVTTKPKDLLVTKTGNTYLYNGPGTNYLLMAIYSPGSSLEVTGRNGEGDWLSILIPPEQTGWVAVSDIETSVDINELVLLAIPPTPQPSITPAFNYSITVVPDTKKIHTESRIYIWKGHLVTISGLKPDEPVNCSTIQVATGKRMAQTSDNADKFGVAYIFFQTSYYPTGMYLVHAELSNGMVLQEYFLVIGG